MQERAEFFSLDKEDNFLEFRAKYLRAGETLKKQGNGGIIEAGLSAHATERMTQRNVSAEAVADARENPLYTKPVVIDQDGRKSQVLIGRFATICINPDTGKIITMWQTGTKTRKKYGGG